MYNLAFKLQVFILELRKNLRYWVMALPILALMIFPLFSFLGGTLYSFALPKDKGYFSLIAPSKTDIKINIDYTKSVELLNGKRLFIQRINNRDNVNYGFRKLVYKVQFIDESGKEVDKDDTKFVDFMMPKEVFYISHLASKQAKSMKVTWLLAESNLVNVIPENLLKFDRKIVELSNLSLDITGEAAFNLNFLVNNLSGKTLKDIKYQYLVTNKESEIEYVGNLTISELKDFDKSAKSVTNLSYPVGQNKNDLLYITDNNKLRYNFFEYEQ
jgi:hypothetical protein